MPPGLILQNTTAHILNTHIASAGQCPETEVAGFGQPARENETLRKRLVSPMTLVNIIIPIKVRRKSTLKRHWLTHMLLLRLIHQEISKLNQSLCKTKELHALIIRTHLSQDPFYATKIIRFYAINDDINSAHHVFGKTSNRSIYLWNSIIRAYAQAYKFRAAFSLFAKMLRTEIRPDNYTYACTIRASSENFDLLGLRLVHGGVMVSGFGLDSICSSALVTAYSKMGFVDEARSVFNGVLEPDLVLWNSMISGYGYSGFWDKGVQLFNAMQCQGKKPDGYTLVGLLLGLVDSSLLSIGQSIHSFVLKSGLDCNAHVGSSLVSMYSRCKCMDSAYRVFYNLWQHDLVAWSALIAGYSESGDHEMSLNLFRKLNLTGKKVDSVLIASVLASIAQSAFVGPGSEIHGYVIRNGLESDVMVSSALIDMYSKCGLLRLGLLVFEIMPRRNIISYNSVISGLGLHGCAIEAFKIFDRILEKGLIPDECTFSALLSACCHSRLVKDGRRIFRRMKDEFCIQARPEHYVHMVKLLGISGEWEEAYDLIQSLPEPVDEGILGALLSCCEVHGNSELAESLAHRLCKGNPQNGAYRILLSNTYAVDGRWGDVEKLRDGITVRLRKLPGLSRVSSNFC